MGDFYNFLQRCLHCVYIGRAPHPSLRRGSIRGGRRFLSATPTLPLPHPMSHKLVYNIIMYKNIDIAYLAGLIDGEGHFYKPKTVNGRGEHSPQSRMLFVQSQKNNGKELCEWARNIFGGGITLTRGMYRWQIVGKKAEELARILQPYLIVKREQVKRIL